MISCTNLFLKKEDRVAPFLIFDISLLFKSELDLKKNINNSSNSNKNFKDVVDDNCEILEYFFIDLICENFLAVC